MNMGSNDNNIPSIRYFLAIIRRFWIVIVLLPLLVGGGSFVLFRSQPPRYGSIARILVTQSPQHPEEQKTFLNFDRHYSWVNSEFILDDLAQVLQSTIFAQDVQAWIKKHDQQSLTIEQIKGRVTVSILHRTATLHATTDSPDHATIILAGTIACLQENGLRYWQGTPDASSDTSRALQDEASLLRVAMLDPPSSPARLNGFSWALKQSMMRAVLALAVAMGLAFLLHTFDTTLREPAQVHEWIGAPIVGSIPE